MQQPLPSVQNLSPGVELHRITTFSNQYYRQAYYRHDPYLLGRGDIINVNIFTQDGCIPM